MSGPHLSGPIKGQERNRKTQREKEKQHIEKRVHNSSNLCAPNTLQKTLCLSKKMLDRQIFTYVYIYIYRCVCECALNMLKNTSYSFTYFQTPVYSNPRATNNSTTTEPATVCCTPQSILLTVFQKPKTRLQTHVKYVRQRRKNHSQSKKLRCIAF